MEILVLGAGLVGAPMAIDLSKDYKVSIADINQERLNRIKNESINKIRADLSDKKTLIKTVDNYQYIINAVPGFMGYSTLKTLIECKKHVVDIAFFPEEPFTLNEPAEKNQSIVITDCGVAPGMSNILSGYVYNKLDKTETVLIYVGGLPKVREWPYEYKAVFSPVDVIEEYTRPARYIENGKLVTRPALSDTEYHNFAGIGTLESFNSDGIRSLAKTIKADNIKEKTLRYPGHVKLMEILRETGFFDKTPIKINNTSVSPLDFTAKILFPKWELKPGEEDITVMKIIVEGYKNKEKYRYTYDLFDQYDKATSTHSMARTTGYTATMAMRMIINGLFNKTGITVPEYIGQYPECVDFMLNGLAERNVIYKENVEIIKNL
ncbi:MAG: saccharopine dehydrogenase family protein [Marinilabiliales bacterium]